MEPHRADDDQTDVASQAAAAVEQWYGTGVATRAGHGTDVDRAPRD
jgi:hypothetical protein